MIAKRFSEVLEVILTEEEIKQKSEENNKKVLERARLKAEAKRYAEGFSSKIKTADLEIEDTAKILEEGKDLRPVDCEWRPDVDTHEMRAVRLDTFETLRRRPMDGDERREYFQGKLWDSYSPSTPAPDGESNQKAVEEFFDEIKSDVITPDEYEIDGSASQIFTEDDGGTPFPTEYSQVVINQMAEYYCADRIAQGKSVTLCHVLDQPHVITELAKADGENYSHVIAWSVLPIENVTKQEASKLRASGESYLGQEIKVGPNVWVIIGKPQTFTVKQEEADEFTASRCDECGMIDGGHASTCSQSNTLTYDDYLAYAKHRYERNHASHARKMEMRRDPETDAKVRNWLKENSPKGRTAKA